MAKEKTALNLEENLAGLLCYIGIWVTGIIFILLEPKNKFVRFHAMQSIIAFLPLTILGWLFGWLGAPSISWGTWSYNPGIPVLIWLSWLVWVVMVILWLVLMLKAYQGEKFKLPIVGDIAKKNS